MTGPLSLRLFTLALLVSLVLPVSSVMAGDKPPFDTAGGFSRFVQKASGFTWLTKTVANKAAKREIAKYSYHDRLEIKIRPYSGTDLIKGKVKQVNIKAKNLRIEEFFNIRDVVVNSNSETPPWVDLKSGQVKTDVDGDFMIRLTDDDLNAAFNSPQFKDLTKDIKIKIGTVGEQHLFVDHVVADFVGTRLNVKADVGFISPEGKVLSTAPLEVETDLVADANRNLLAFKNVKVKTIAEVQDTSGLEAAIEEYGQTAIKPYKWLKPEVGWVKLSAIKIQPEAMVILGDFHLNERG